MRRSSWHRAQRFPVNGNLDTVSSESRGAKIANKIANRRRAHEPVSNCSGLETGLAKHSLKALRALASTPTPEVLSARALPHFCAPCAA
jgi:hypothetical protein